MSKLIQQRIVVTRPGLPNFQIETTGPVRQQAVDEAWEKIAALVRYAYEPVRFARIRLAIHGHSPGHRFAVAQASLDVGGRAVRVQAAADSIRQAVTEIVDRLPVRLERLARRGAARQEGQPVVAIWEWWRGGRSASAGHYLSRPVADRTVVRHKAVELQVATLEEAIFDMELLDYNIHLFTDAGTGHDAVVQREGDGYRLTLRPSAPRLALRAAIDRVEITGRPYLFFGNAETGRGNVIYRRYDGNYGLITPVGAPERGRYTTTR